jgi:hypothetical protein
MPLPPPRYALTEQQESSAVQLYSSTGSLERVAEHFGVARQTIRRVLARKGVEVGGRGKRQLRPRVTSAAHLFFVYEGSIPVERLAKWADVTPDGLKRAIKQVQKGDR